MTASRKFHEVIRELSGYDAVPIDTDHPILDTLSRGLASLLSKSKFVKYQYKRINEIGTELEREVSDILGKNPEIEVQPFGQRVGYPDMCAKIRGTHVFLEVKATTALEKDTDSQRRFYISSGRKIRHDGHHVLVLLYVKSEGEGFRLRAWRVNDLYDLQIRLKNEYNANSQDFAKLKILCHS